MLGGWGTGIQSLYPEDEGGGEELQGESLGAGALPGLREGFGEGVNGHVPQNPAQSEKMGMGKEGYEEVRGNKTRTFRMAFPEKAGPRP